MLRLNTIIVLSIILVILPFLGLPQSFDDSLYVIFGILIFTSAFLLKKGSRIGVRKRTEDDVQ